NVSTWNVGLKDFDPSLGLRELGGKAIGTIAAYKVVRVPLEAGKSVDIPGGTLVVDSVTAVDKEDEEDRWRIVFTLKPSEEGGKRPSERILERRVRFDGEEVWSYAMYSGRGPTYEIDSRYLKAAPAWMEFRVKSGERKVEAPFKFTDLKWIEK
ncbi:MAG TPA: hypothetical protein VJU16_09475, partial [Planctomycetota bacterium]|nr:hypothetical protein [Planctomycetota bacterium]